MHSTESKWQILINLVKIDGKVTPEEQTFLSQAFQESGLSDQQVRILLAALHTNTNFTLDYEALAAKPEEIVGLLTKMVALVRCDDELPSPRNCISRR
ncbi:hypothetical protein [Chloroflexus sp.]|uniref:hypothetical protein n=1 Tax=Chloroflexus sp. TaxID=1904827 RepID=UPI002ACEA86F|nr:hypothetical protein [Chloroflexus sp.]